MRINYAVACPPLIGAPPNAVIYNYGFIAASDKNNAYLAEVPDLPGCMADGNSNEEALKNAEMVIEEWIDTAEQLNGPVPEPKKGKLIYACCS